MKLSEYCRIKWERARDLRKKGDHQEAEGELKEALEEQPDHPLLMAALAEVYLRQERFVEARIIAESILSTQPQYAQALYLLGEIYSKEKNFDEALQFFRQARQKDDRPYLTLRVVRTLRDMGRFDEALETLDSLLVIERENARFLKEKAVILNRMKRWDEALSLYEKVNELDPEDSFVRKEVYRLRSRKRPDEKVIQELETVVNLPARKDDAQLHGLLGQDLKEAGNLEKALTEFRTARRLDPNNPYFWKMEGFCHYRMGSNKEAIDALSRAFRANPNDFRVRATLKKLFVTTKNISGFVALLEDVLNAHPHNVKLIGILKGLKKVALAEGSEDR